jgi:quercetin dioxygenase-like cupin family protein
MDRQAFLDRLTAGGYGEPEAREFAPHYRTREHAHDYDGLLMVLHGTLVGEWEGKSHSCQPGFIRELPAGTLHTDGAGPEGAKYLLARRQ